MVSVALKSKELDPYFVARADGVVVPKPSLKLTDWWRAILQRIETVKREFWTEIAYIFLGVDHDAQEEAERRLEQLVRRIQNGDVEDKHNCLTLTNGNKALRQHGIVVFPYRVATRDERNQMALHFASELEEKSPVLGIAVVGIDVNEPTYPYDFLAFVPGHAKEAPDFGRLVREPGVSPGT